MNYVQKGIFVSKEAESSGVRAKLLVLVGNDLAPAKIEAELAKAPGIMKILFGFQVSGGKKEADHYVCERFGGSWMDLGQLHGDADPRLKKWTERMFEGGGRFVLGQNETSPCPISTQGSFRFLCRRDV